MIISSPLVRVFQPAPGRPNPALKVEDDGDEVAE